MNTISFRELAKMIHPDLNPTITDPGLKMSEAVKFKNYPNILYKKAIEWGLIKDSTFHSTNRTTTSRTTNRTTWTASEDGTINIQDSIIVYKRNGSLKGCVVDIQTVKRGKKKGWFKYFIVGENNKLYTSIRMNMNGSSSFRKIEKTDDYSYENKYKNLYNRYLENVNNNKERKKERKQRREEKVKRDLNPNFDYTGYNIWVFVSTKGMFYKVTRTTNKRVYFWDEHSQKERFCNFSSVGMVDVR